MHEEAKMTEEVTHNPIKPVGEREDDLSAKEIFLDALELDIGQRSKFVDQACRQEPALIAEVHALLASQESHSTSVMNLDFGRVLMEELQTNAPEEDAQRGIGRYEIGRELGRGGCAIVFHGKQTEPVTRDVAIKMMHNNATSRVDLLNRFRFEQRTQALMDHPNIARVLDAGETNEGVPFLVMEFVDGMRITSYCDEHRLTIHQRLELFLDVCHGVQHAHQKGIIHRDLKPSNVLVSCVNDKHVAKVIDFGVAKATGELEFANADETLVGQLIGSPAYMSPEQFLSGSDIDTRSDVYCLGVLLHELMAGRHPFSGSSFSSLNFGDLSELVQRVAPQDLSSISDLPAEELSATAQARSIESRKLCAVLRADLNWIVLKCLEKDRNDRYASANGLAADVQRYLSDLPVVAGPPTTRYLVAKFVKRNKRAVFSTALVLISLALGLVGTSIAMIQANQQAILAEREKNHALAERSRADVYSELAWQTTESIAIASWKKDKSYRHILRNSLDQTVKLLDAGEIDDEVAEAEVRYRLGELYLQIGSYEESEQQARDALRLRKSIFGTESPAYLRARGLLAGILRKKGKLKESAEIVKEVYKVRQRILPPNHLDLIRSLGNMAKLAPPNQAESYYLLALPNLEEHINSKNHKLVTSIKYNYGAFLWRQKEHGKAVEIFRQLLANEIAYLGPVHPRTMRARFSLAENLRQDSRLDEAMEVALEMCAIDNELGQPHPERLLVLAGLQQEKGDVQGAIKSSKAAIKIMDKANTSRIEMLQQVIDDLESEAESGSKTKAETGLEPESTDAR